MTIISSSFPSQYLSSVLRKKLVYLGIQTSNPLYQALYSTNRAKKPVKVLGDNKSTACGCQCLAVAAFSLKFLSPNRGIILANLNLELSPLFVCIPIFIVNIPYEIFFVGSKFCVFLQGVLNFCLLYFCVC